MARARGNGTTETQTKPRSDAYVGLLFISLVAQVIGAVFFFLDWQQYPTNKPPEVKPITAPAPAPGPQGQPQPGPGAAGGAQGGAAGQPAGGMVGGANK